MNERTPSSDIASPETKNRAVSGDCNSVFAHLSRFVRTHFRTGPDRLDSTQIVSNLFLNEAFVWQRSGTLQLNRPSSGLWSRLMHTIFSLVILIFNSIRLGGQRAESENILQYFRQAAQPATLFFLRIYELFFIGSTQIKSKQFAVAWLYGSPDTSIRSNDIMQLLFIIFSIRLPLHASKCEKRKCLCLWRQRRRRWPASQRPVRGNKEKWLFQE